MEKVKAIPLEAYIFSLTDKEERQALLKEYRNTMHNYHVINLKKFVASLSRQPRRIATRAFKKSGVDVNTTTNYIISKEELASFGIDYFDVRDMINK
ncbi:MULTISPECIES: hypothetical protein [Bacillus]|uniref:Uncharacterized protein n=2 Tax=Bacillus thuringiensis TaxID=1428 RepID=A0AAP4Q6I2_BACTU|nr:MULTISPECIES: hypothetical protein [Bacillus]HDR7922746.1 hypothetical protein [Bacillus paranthracis]AFV22067.1 hypothetical protein BTB_502p07620 [Bacillus thuringiensis Bt407]EEM24916.1 hypothetical protein bthur0002_55580 [Bacillus thuringiensis Bt407]ERI00756.1 hypothetical protein BTCBT_002311 [Bacillus thuringiensis T01-328]MBN6707540.1 hypothetical protein [Bacillus thuringiensis]